MTTLTQLRTWEPATLDAVVDTLSTTLKHLGEVEAGLRSGQVPPGWRAGSADAARERERQLVRDLATLLAGVTAVRRAVDEAGPGLVAAQAAVQEAEELARRNGFSVS